MTNFTPGDGDAANLIVSVMPGRFAKEAKEDDKSGSFRTVPKRAFTRKTKSRVKCKGRAKGTRGKGKKRELEKEPVQGNDPKEEGKEEGRRERQLVLTFRISLNVRWEEEEPEIETKSSTDRMPA